MKIAVVGTRGFPQIQGGIETHCENLYPRLAEAGCEVIVFTRKPYVTFQGNSYKGVALVALSSPRNKFLEAIVHTFKGVFFAKKVKCDILHIQGIGPSLCAPLARLMGFKVVVTNHGPDYERNKWGFFAKLSLRIGEFLACTYANEMIVISDYIAKRIKKKYNRASIVIPNGVSVSKIIETDSVLKEFGLEKRRYILSIGRFVPEKGLHDLIAAFNRASIENWKLVIAGRADHEDSYSRQLKENAGNNKNIILTGFLTGKSLQELYSSAGFFVLPSYYEGLPIVLLEAMSYGLPCLISDVPGNRAVELAEKNYFTAGNIEQLTAKLCELVKEDFTEVQRQKQIELVGQKYDWNKIAQKTLEVYKKVL